MLKLCLDFDKISFIEVITILSYSLVLKIEFL